LKLINSQDILVAIDWYVTVVIDINITDITWAEVAGCSILIVHIEMISIVLFGNCEKVTNLCLGVILLFIAVF
jgi:hypothetical protein